MENTATKKVIFSQTLAGWLMMKGFILIALGENRKYPSKNVFIFKQSDALNEAINEFLSNEN